jgi:hypothetical protein
MMFGPHWVEFAEHVKRMAEEPENEVPWMGEMDSAVQDDLIGNIDKAIAEFLGEPVEKEESEGC